MQSSAWSKTKEKRAKRAARKQKKQLRKERLATETTIAEKASSIVDRKRPANAMDVEDAVDDDADSIVEDYKKVKKLKNRKVGGEI